MIEIPYKELSQEALQGVIDAYILREGTDYGPVEYDLAEKRQRILRQLEAGQAQIVFYPESDHIDLVLTK